MNDYNQYLAQYFDEQCNSSVVHTEWTLHQLSPYIGKLKSSIAKFLIGNFTIAGDTVYDPFCGAGTIPLEAWIQGRHVIANDLNDYAVLLTKAKLFPPIDLAAVLSELDHLEQIVKFQLNSLDISTSPKWVSDFFHPETFKEIIAWTALLKQTEKWFLLSCLLGILHHQRPGFLSFPSSHTVPYLRLNKFPKEQFPDMYLYRNVKERLAKKVQRAMKKLPNADTKLNREVLQEDASKQMIEPQIDALITSPPYMRQLDYGRDNRLRLWFLGQDDFKALDSKISPKESDFIASITTCLENWTHLIKPGGKCILFLGDNYSARLKLRLPDILHEIAVHRLQRYKLIFKHESLIPDNRRVRRNHTGNKSETLLVFQTY